MRKELSTALIKRSKNSNLIFFTADLGFMALEKLRDSLKNRFINAGISEQNMISVGASMTRKGFEVWCYSIAPFCYARPFEQIRNDVCFHNFPLKIIGNGGGYGYGVMGPSHHAIEDYGILLTLPNILIYVPAFNEDLNISINRIALNKKPSYLRLGVDEKPLNFIVPKYSPWRQLIQGKGPVIICLGPIVGTYLESFLKLTVQKRPKLWVLCELPIDKKTFPSNLKRQIKTSKALITIEEHVEQGSFASQLLLFMYKENISIKKFKGFYAKKHIYDISGSQKELRNLSGLSPKTINYEIKKILK